jgi:hypothetical protein
VSARFPSRELVPAGARQCGRPSRARGAFHRRRTTPAPFRGPAWRAVLRWPAEPLPHVFIVARKPRLDLCSPAGGRRFPGRVRSCDFCKWMFPRARPWTARTSRATGEGGRDGCRGRAESRLSGSGATAEGAQGQGSRTPILDVPHRDCSQQRLRPDPDRFGHLVSQTSASSLSGATWGEGDAAIATVRLHGAHRVRVVRRRFSAKRTGVHQPEGPSVGRPFAFANGRGPLRSRSCKEGGFGAFFTAGDPARGTLAQGPLARSHGKEGCCRALLPP